MAMSGCEDNSRHDILKVGICMKGTGCSLNIVFFPYLKCMFLNSTTSDTGLVFHLIYGGPSMKSGVHTPRENSERPESRIYFAIFESRTQYLINTLYD